MPRDIRPHSIRARLTLTFTLLIALLLGSADGVLLLYSRRGASHHADRALREAVDATRKAIADEEEEARETAGERRPEKTEKTAFDLPGAVLQDLRQPLAEEQMAILLIGNQGRAWNAGNPRGNPAWTPEGRSGAGHGWRVRPVPLPVAADTPISASLRAAFVAYPWWREEEELRSRLLALAALSLFAVLATAVGAWILVGGTLRPIDQLARQASGVATPRTDRTDRRVSLVPPSPDVEVVRLVETLNHLLARVQESADARGRFYAAASHELRTPLHVLAGQVELTLNRPRTSDEYRLALTEVNEQANRLTALVESLLLLDRLERETSAVRATAPVAEIVAACRRTLDGQAATIARRELTASLHADDFGDARNPARNQGTNAASRRPVYQPVYQPVCQNVWGELAHAEILLRNLVDNAVRYTPVGGSVSLRLHASSTGGLEFVCENDVPGDLSAAMTERLGDAFFRPDASRATTTGGNGLGLAICRALAETNGWELTLRYESPLLRVGVLFPEAET